MLSTSSHVAGVALWKVIQLVLFHVYLIMGDGELWTSRTSRGGFTNPSKSSAPSEWSCCTESGSYRCTLPLGHCGLTARSPAGCRMASSGTPRSQKCPSLASQCNLNTEEETPLQYVRLLKDSEMLSRHKHRSLVIPGGKTNGALKEKNANENKIRDP